jgi:hypothetical protein
VLMAALTLFGAAGVMISVNRLPTRPVPTRRGRSQHGLFA